MDFCTEVAQVCFYLKHLAETPNTFATHFQNPKRGRFCFELRMTAGHKSVTLAADNEADLQDWLSKLHSIIHQNKLQEDKRLHSLERAPPPSPSTIMFGTLKGLDQSMNPQLIKYGRETDVSIAQARREQRKRLFHSYRASLGKPPAIAEVIEPYR